MGLVIKRFSKIIRSHCNRLFSFVKWEFWSVLENGTADFYEIFRFYLFLFMPQPNEWLVSSYGLTISLNQFFLDNDNGVIYNPIIVSFYNVK